MGQDYGQEDLQNRNGSGLQETSTATALVIAGMMSLNLVVDIWRRKYDTRRGTDLANPIQLVDDTVDRWQQDWLKSTKRRWIDR